MPSSCSSPLTFRRLGLLTAAALILSDLLHRWASEWHFPEDPPADVQVGESKTEAIVVLGFPPPKRGGTNAIQRWRTRIAVRSMDPAASSVLVFTGRGFGDRQSEAESMAAYALQLGVDSGSIELEPNARSTAENIDYSTPLFASAQVIKIASDPIHSARARRYLWRTNPALAGRLRPAEDYQTGEQPLLKLGASIYEIYRWAVLFLLRHNLGAAAGVRSGMGQSNSSGGPDSQPGGATIAAPPE